MKNLRKLVVLLIIATLLLPSFALAKDNAKIAKVLSLSGDVQVKKGGGEKKFKAFKNMGLTQGDTIITGIDGKVTIELDKDKEVVIGSGTQLVISELVSSIKAESGKTSLNLLGGKVSVTVKEKLKGDSKFEIKTPTSVMGVRGTHFFVNVNPSTGDTYLAVASGLVAVAPPPPAPSAPTFGFGSPPSPEPIIVNPAQQLSLPAGSAPGPGGVPSPPPTPQPLDLGNLDSSGLEALQNAMQRNPEQFVGTGMNEQQQQLQQLFQQRQQEEAQMQQQQQQQQQQQEQQQQQQRRNSVTHAPPARPPAPPAPPTPAPPVVNEPEPYVPPVVVEPRIEGATNAEYIAGSNENVTFTLHLNGGQLLQVVNKSYATGESNRYTLKKQDSPGDSYWDYKLEGTQLVISSYYLKASMSDNKETAKLELQFASGKKIELNIKLKGFVLNPEFGTLDMGTKSDIHFSVKLNGQTIEGLYYYNYDQKAKLDESIYEISSEGDIASVTLNGEKIAPLFSILATSSIEFIVASLSGFEASYFVTKVGTEPVEETPMVPEIIEYNNTSNNSLFIPILLNGYTFIGIEGTNAPNEDQYEFDNTSSKLIISSEFMKSDSPNMLTLVFGKDNNVVPIGIEVSYNSKPLIDRVETTPNHNNANEYEVNIIFTTPIELLVGGEELLVFIKTLNNGATFEDLFNPPKVHPNYEVGTDRITLFYNRSGDIALPINSNYRIAEGVMKNPSTGDVQDRPLFTETPTPGEEGYEQATTLRFNKLMDMHPIYLLPNDDLKELMKVSYQTISYGSNNEELLGPEELLEEWEFYYDPISWKVYISNDVVVNDWYDEAEFFDQLKLTFEFEAMDGIQNMVTLVIESSSITDGTPLTLENTEYSSYDQTITFTFSEMIGETSLTYLKDRLYISQNNGVLFMLLDLINPIVDIYNYSDTQISITLRDPLMGTDNQFLILRDSIRTDGRYDLYHETFISETIFGKNEAPTEFALSWDKLINELKGYFDFIIHPYNSYLIDLQTVAFKDDTELQSFPLNPSYYDSNGEIFIENIHDWLGQYIHAGATRVDLHALTNTGAYKIFTVPLPSEDELFNLEATGSVTDDVYGEVTFSLNLNNLEWFEENYMGDRVYEDQIWLTRDGKILSRVDFDSDLVERPEFSNYTLTLKFKPEQSLYGNQNQFFFAPATIIDEDSKLNNSAISNKIDGNMEVGPKPIVIDYYPSIYNYDDLVLRLTENSTVESIKIQYPINNEIGNFELTETDYVHSDFYDVLIIKKEILSQWWVNQLDNLHNKIHIRFTDGTEVTVMFPEPLVTGIEVNQKW